jgi:hypothetical protein
LGVLRVSTSVAYLRKRLADIGRYDLLEACERGEVSTYACAEEAGLVTRRPIEGNGSPNQAKKRAWDLARITRQTKFSPPPKRDVLNVQTRVKQRQAKSTEEPKPKLKLDVRALIG